MHSAPSPLALGARPPHPTLWSRLRALVVIDFDLGDLGLDAATVHADLAELFERGDALAARPPRHAAPDSAAPSVRGFRPSPRTADA